MPLYRAWQPYHRQASRAAFSCLRDMHTQYYPIPPSVVTTWLLILKLKALRLAFKLGTIREIRERGYGSKWGAQEHPPTVCLHLNGKNAEFGGRSDRDKAKAPRGLGGFHLAFVICYKWSFVSSR